MKIIKITLNDKYTASRNSSYILLATQSFFSFLFSIFFFKYLQKYHLDFYLSQEIERESMDFRIQSVNFHGKSGLLISLIPCPSICKGLSTRKFFRETIRDASKRGQNIESIQDGNYPLETFKFTLTLPSVELCS